MENKNEFLLDTFIELPYKAQKLIFEYENIIELLDDTAILILECESPIEQIFYIALIRYLKEIGGNLYLNPQTEIECNGKKYYADFTICYDEILNDFLKEDFNLIIECDGYEFHQKTKEQVEYDNKREYDLKMQGYEILRFSGREIYNNPMECAKKTIEYIKEKNNDKR